MSGRNKRTSQTHGMLKAILFQLILRIVTIRSIFRRILPRHVNSEWRQSSNSSEPRGRCVIHGVSGWENMFVRMPGNNKGHSPPHPGIMMMRPARHGSATHFRAAVLHDAAKLPGT